ncbi:hypothetical protein SD80_024590 [Scytonema tolypothrichoides VB-61278]|nr:hypothetical protein SD80_024590 [Scytonema tolypothrichoides VB-61278]
MHFDAEIKNIEIYKNQERPGFHDKFHKVRFLLQSEGIKPMTVDIWVHPNYPEENMLKVAKTFLHRRLLDFVELTSGDIYKPEEVDAIWQSVKPEFLS